MTRLANQTTSNCKTVQLRRSWFHGSIGSAGIEKRQGTNVAEQKQIRLKCPAWPSRLLHADLNLPFGQMFLEDLPET